MTALSWYNGDKVYNFVFGEDDRQALVNLRSLDARDATLVHFIRVEEESVFTFTNNHRIGKLCVATSTSELMCNSAHNPEIKTLTISFNRPKQQANIYVNGSTTLNATVYTWACIQIDSLKSPTSGYVRSLYVYRSGMINKEVGICQ